MARKKPSQPGAYIPPPESRSGRDRSWDRNHNSLVVTYRKIPPELQQAVKQIADQKHIPVGEVARRFLEYGLQAYQDGALDLQPVLGSGKLTLFPGDDS